MNSRDKKIISKIKELSVDVDANEIFNLFTKYEETNIKIIDKLNRTRIVEKNRIKGALKQTIDAHGPIDMKLIGSATKRISGALISNIEVKPKPNLNSFFWGLILGSLVTLLLI